MDKPDISIKIVLFDFGGVLAEEGFRNGLYAIARKNGSNEEKFFTVSREIMYRSGYVTGRTTEDIYWQAVRNETGITGSDEDLRNEILSRFTPRPWMFDIVRQLKKAGMTVTVLSDQTNWLDELNTRFDFFPSFDAVFNSYHLGKSKADESQFSDIIARFHCEPRHALFIDDDEAHCERARRVGLHAIRYTRREIFLQHLEALFSGNNRIKKPVRTGPDRR